jgi:hypothetical protein
VITCTLTLAAQHQRTPAADSWSVTIILTGGWDRRVDGTGVPPVGRRKDRPDAGTTRPSDVTHHQANSRELPNALLFAGGPPGETFSIRGG